jgi:hypothetical protein
MDWPGPIAGPGLLREQSLAGDNGRPGLARQKIGRGPVRDEAA